MSPKLSKITEETLIPLGLVIALVGAAVYVNNIDAQGKACSLDVEKLSKKQDEYVRDLEHIDMRLSRIEGALHARSSR